MQIAEEDIHYYKVNGIAYTFMWDENIHKYFHAGVPIAELARIRGCSVSRIKTLVKSHEGELQVKALLDDGKLQLKAFHRRLDEQVLFDKRLA